MADTLAVRGALAETEVLIQRARVAILAELRTRWASATPRQKNAILAALDNPPAVAAARYVAATGSVTGADGSEDIADAQVEARVSEFLTATLPAASV